MSAAGLCNMRSPSRVIMAILALMTVVSCRCVAAPIEPAALLDNSPAPRADFQLEQKNPELETFVSKLQEIASRNDWLPVLMAERIQPRYYGFTDAHAVRRTRDGITNYFTVFHTKDLSFPGEDEILVYILDSRGRLIDSIACQVNNRLTVDPSAKFHAVFPEMKELDNSDVIIRIDGIGNHGNFQHDVIYRNTRYSFYWGDDAKGGPTVWDHSRLLRIRIEKNRMLILHPDLASATRHYELRNEAQPARGAGGASAVGASPAHP